jgi:hypothetical protein
VAEVQRLVRGDRDSMVLLLTHLAELGSRKLHLAAGYRSLFAYCTQFLRLSEHEAFHRILAARTARKFPRILARLGDGRLNLTTVKLLAPHLTAGNEPELVDAASGKTRREVEVLVAERFPQPDVPAAVRKVPAPRQPIAPTARSSENAEPLPAPVLSLPPMGTATAAFETACEQTAADAFSLLAQIAPPAAAPASARPAVVQPIARDRYEVRFTATAEAVERLRLVQDMLGHAVPDGDLAAVVDRAVVVLLENLASAKFAATPRPRPSRDTVADSRHVPANVKRVVWVRDTGRCAFVAKSGHHCDARRFLEFHHRKPYAEGGQATVENLELRCRAHNGYEAHVYYDASRTGRADGLATESHPRYGLFDQQRTRPGPSSVSDTTGRA